MPAAARPTLLLLFAAASVLLAGCPSSPPSSDEPGESAAAPVDAAATRTPTIGYSALTLTNPFFQTIADTMEAEADASGFELVVVSGENDVKRQADQVDDFIVRGVAAIVLNPCDSRSIGPAIEKANAAGIPVFTNDIQYDGEAGEVVCHIATDNLQGGRLAAEAIIAHLTREGRSGGRVAILHFPQVESCQLRVQGFEEIIGEHNEKSPEAAIEVVSTLDGGGSRDQGFRAAKDVVEAHPELDAIFAINDPSALGAWAALEAAGKEDRVAIVGFDGQRIGKQAIRDGKILADPIQFPGRIGRTTIEQIARYFAGEQIEPVILIPSELYGREDALADPELADPAPNAAGGE